MPNRALPDPRRFPFGCDARLKLCAALLGWLCVLSAARPAAPLWIAGCAVGSLLVLRVPLRSLLRPLSAGLFSACVALVLRALLTREGPAIPLSLLVGQCCALYRERQRADPGPALRARTVRLRSARSRSRCREPVFGDVLHLLLWPRGDAESGCGTRRATRARLDR